MAEPAPRCQQACLNHGNCTNIDGAWKCKCPPTHEGDYCEKERPSELKRFLLSVNHSIHRIAIFSMVQVLWNAFYLITDVLTIEFSFEQFRYTQLFCDSVNQHGHCKKGGFAQPLVILSNTFLKILGCLVIMCYRQKGRVWLIFQAFCYYLWI